MKSVLEIPGYIEALDREQLSRDAAFLPIPERIGEFNVFPMTLSHFLILRVAQSPFLCPTATPTRDQLAAFLWIVSPEYDYQPPDKEFLKRCRFSDGQFAKMTRLAYEYVEDALIDRPAGPGSSGFKPPYYSDAAFWCVLLKQPRAEVLATPIKCLFQFLRAYMEQNTPTDKLNLFNARSSGVVNNYLRAKNETN